jgi:hypothetical protein
MTREEVEAFHPGRLIPWEQHRLDVTCGNGERYRGRFLFTAGAEKGLEHDTLMLDQPDEQQIRTIWIEEILSIERVES